ncbi:MAG: serine protein kinase PrkA [Planctomycetota bacterium]|nr:MAG: serine protein kinase PrkA [Planctomycetota bacterium]
MAEQVQQRVEHDLMELVSSRSQERFAARQQILSFAEYFAEVARDPRRHTRDAARYLKDCFDHFGTTEVRGLGRTLRRFKLFDAPWDGGETQVLGQEELQNAVYKHLVSFCEKGRVDKLLMIHGPNGTAKSTFVECLIGALRHYSSLPEGALYRFNWVFSDSAERAALGFHEKVSDLPEDGSLAHLPAEEITFKLGDELKDHPLLLIPSEERGEVLARLFGEPDPDVPAFLRHGDLCAKNREIYRALSNAYKGDWRRIVQHVQVERIDISQRYRSCAVVIQPQRNVDASSRPLNLEKSYRLPPILNQSSLSELSGDLVDGNRGIVEYSDFFKRPLELSKYLLTTSEKGSISLPDTTAYLDCVFFATANEKNLTLFKRNPDFPSFKGRFELIRAPYLLRYSVEERLYADRIHAIAESKHVAPHVTRIVALWAVLTRLRRPNPRNYKGELSGLVARLRPVEKAVLYDSGEPPRDWSDVERKELRANITLLAEEYDTAEEEFEGLLDAAYEGRRGASPREIMAILHEAALLPDRPCLTPLAVLEAVREASEDKSLYEFLRLAPEAGYHDVESLTDDVETEYRRIVRDEVHRALALVEERAYEQLFEDYFRHVKAYDSGEKVLSPITKKLEDPDERLMARVESLMDIDEKPADFRKNLIVRIAAWVIDHPGRPVAYREIFSDILEALRASYHREREAAIEQIQEQILRYGTEDWELVEPADQERVVQAVERLRAMGYCEQCSKEALSYVLRHRGED